MALLAIKDLNVHYGGIHALKTVSIHVPEEKVVTLVGANGAGKSTLLRAVSGLVPASSGSIRYTGREILGIPSHRIAREGIAMSPEGRRVFVNLSVYENLLMGAYCRDDKKEIDRDIEWIFETFPRLLERRDQPRADGGRRRPCDVLERGLERRQRRRQLGLRWLRCLCYCCVGVFCDCVGGSSRAARRCSSASRSPRWGAWSLPSTRATSVRPQRRRPCRRPAAKPVRSRPSTTSASS